ncbi:bacterial transcriptional activator domain-containing protein [Desulfonatronum sp. SC1]|uniref:bacterial transcriptional activator domain-containing protein n=1 Tax=Desulfonatronum sp. SC1 TaxID=2109626 RepID=UPI000D30043E|nr:bacterial transcriptional activator domain-containing protein [Desulfonatronum sp. SC1]PTN31501.1 hypothetical protein C6366_18050 [Desulfonatronum sp. SC1]
MSINPAVCLVDLMDFEQTCSKVEQIFAGNGRVLTPELGMLSEKALSLYQGDFLAQDTAAWVVAIREKQKTRCLRVLERLIKLHEQAGHREMVETVCERALQVEPLREDFYRRLILFFLQTGRKADAVNVFERCGKIFRAELGSEPSESLRGLVADLDYALRSINSHPLPSTFPPRSDPCE